VEKIDVYLSGKLLYGNDFNADQIAEWYADEREGYASLGAKNAASYKYGYHALNVHHAFRHLRKGLFPHVMGFGSAYGEEFLPIISSIGRLTIVDPSDAFASESVHGVPATYIKPSVSGSVPLEDDTVDLITCLGVLHHIPNVSFVIGEFMRTLKPGGTVLLREPIVSMGDWRKPRRGVTKRERGIPVHILRRMVLETGLIIERQGYSGFPLTPRLFRYLRSGVYNSGIATKIDACLAAAFAWNTTYHARNVFQRLRPTSVFLILRKPQLGPMLPLQG
jgi:SAM-dependent methyltransferase